MNTSHSPYFLPPTRFSKPFFCNFAIMNFTPSSVILPSAFAASPTRPERAEAPSPGHRPGYVVCKPVALKGQKLSNTRQKLIISTSPPNPGIRNSHHIPHYIIARTLYIPLQTNALCDALSDWRALVYMSLIPRVLPWARSFCPFRACGVSRMKHQGMWGTAKEASVRDICNLFLSFQQ